MSTSPSESEIVTTYKAGNPNRQNSRKLVAEIAAAHGLTVGKVRNVLVKAGVYISLPKDKSKIEESDRAELRAAFHRHAAEHGFSDRYSGPDDLVSELSERMGYGKWTLGDSYREWKDSTQPKNFQTDEAEDNGPVYYRSNIPKLIGVAVIILVGFVIFVLRTDYKRSTSGTYEASNSAFPTQGTATATERREYSVDRSETPTGMDSAQRDQYERMSPEGKEYVDRQMEAYDAICEGSSEC